MNKYILPAILLTILSTGCGGSGDDLGTQIDGMGRPAVNTALINTFAADADRDVSEDDFNATENDDRARFADTERRLLRS